jgi:predicted transcriptional regulator
VGFFTGGEQRYLNGFWNHNKKPIVNRFFVVYARRVIPKKRCVVQLGELEKLVLNYLWSVGSADAKQVYDHFKQTRGGSLNTIQSTLDRLYKKRILKREKLSHAFQYSAAMEKEAFLGQLIRNVTQDFSADHEHLLAAFINLSADLDEAHLDRLEALIRDSREQKKGS